MENRAWNRRWRFVLLDTAGMVRGDGWIVAPTASIAKASAERSLAGLCAVEVLSDELER